jgi:hypothetical protein
VANVRDQQIEVGARIASRTPASASVLVGDAGAIPFVSQRSAIDALGLGGFHRLPFARAAVHGEPATIELIERLPPSERPTHLALYPNWFSSITGRFGVEIDRVTITDNIICGGTTKGIYRADWTALDAPRAPAAGVIDEIDVADVVSEAEHAYAAPLPGGGWTTLEVLANADGARRFDGGRIIPEGTREWFVVRGAIAGTRARIRVRLDPWAQTVRVHTRGASTDLVLDPVREGAWREGTATLDALTTNDTIALEAVDGQYRDYHVWIETL